MPSIVHIDVAADNPRRAKKFYETLFDWKMDSPPGMDDYFLFETVDAEGRPGFGGGLGKRRDRSQAITSYIGVESIEAYSVKVEKLGGTVVEPKMPVPGWGYIALCIDTEGNTFGLWQDDPDAG